MKKHNCSHILGYNDLKEGIHTINCNSTIETHISLEQAISSSCTITEDERIVLLSSLFIVSLNKGTYHPHYILCRLGSLVISPVTKQKLIQLVCPEIDRLTFPPQKKTSHEGQFSAFKTKSVITYRR